MSRQGELIDAAVKQIRDALDTLSMASDGHYETEAHYAMDAIDWLEPIARAAPEPE